MQKLFIAVTFVAFLVACKQKNNATTNTVNTIDTVKFYPYTYALQKQADSLAKGNFKFIKKLVFIDSNKTINANITSQEFLQFANLFISKNVADSTIKQLYKESVFNDLTTNSIVINYSTKVDSLHVKNVDIHLNATTNNFERIDMKVFTPASTITFIENYTWILGKEFYIIKSVQNLAKKTATTKVSISWKK